MKCLGDIAGTYKFNVYILLSHALKKQQIVVFTMVVFVWLVPVIPTQLEGEWSTAVMECGGLSVAQGLIQEMVKWYADNLDTRILVS